MAVSFCCSLEDRMSQLNHDRGGQEAELQIQEKFQSGNSSPGAFTFGEKRLAWPSWEGSRAGESSSLGGPLAAAPSAAPSAALPSPGNVLGQRLPHSSLSPQQISVSQIKVDKVQIIGVQSSFAVCLDQDEQKILQSVTRWELQPEPLGWGTLSCGWERAAGFAAPFPFPLCLQPHSHSLCLCSPIPCLCSPIPIPARFPAPFPVSLQPHSRCPRGFSAHTSPRGPSPVSPAGVRSPCATSPGTVTPWHPEGPQCLPRTPPSSSPCCVCPSPPSAGPCPRGAVSLQTRLHPTPVQAQEEEKDTQPCLARSSCSCRVAVVSVVAELPLLWAWPLLRKWDPRALVSLGFPARGGRQFLDISLWISRCQHLAGRAGQGQGYSLLENSASGIWG